MCLRSEVRDGIVVHVMLVHELSSQLVAVLPAIGRRRVCLNMADHIRRILRVTFNMTRNFTTPQMGASSSSFHKHPICIAWLEGALKRNSLRRTKFHRNFARRFSRVQLPKVGISSTTNCRYECFQASHTPSLLLLNDTYCLQNLPKYV